MLKLFRKISTIILAICFVFICTYMYTTDKMYVFSYSNEDVIYSGNKNSNKIALMFNVYSGSEYVNQILSILNKYSLKCTFFVGGIWVEKNIETMLSLHMQGHEIANHGYLHKNHEKLDYDSNIDEILANHNLVKSYLNIDMNLFAPPSGSFNKSTLTACYDLNYNVIMWTRDTIDWRDQDVDLIYNRAIRNAQGGDFILMHPTKCTVDALPMIITYMISHNYILSTVSDVISI